MPGIHRSIERHSEEPSGPFDINFQQSGDIPRDCIQIPPLTFSSLFGEGDFSLDERYAVVSLLPGTSTGDWKLIKCRRGKDISDPTTFVGLDPDLSYRGRGLVASTTPLILTEVILELDSSYYHQLIASRKALVNGNQDDISQYLSQHGSAIVRQGDIIPELSCRVISCDPVEQGIFSIDQTNLIVVNRNESSIADGIVPDQTGLEDSEDDPILSHFLGRVQSEPNVSNAIIQFKVEALKSRLAYYPMLENMEDESQAFIEAGELAKLGCFSGDWILLNTGISKRYVQVFSTPEGQGYRSSTIYLPPVLFYNLGQPHSIDAGVSQPRLIPAKEVSIARISSPVTTDRSLQHSFLSGLRSHFENSKRILCKNDIIAVPIDTFVAHALSFGLGKGSTEDINDSLTIPQGRPNDVAWFSVTGLTSNSPPEDQTNTHSNIQYIIDPQTTTMVQTGSINAHIPPASIPWRSYLSIPTIPATDSKPATYLRKVLSASLSPIGTSLVTSILVHSSKHGTGKMTTIRSVAADLGLHVFEIDAYQTIGDSETKTIGILEARLERAALCDPCIVVIRHIEAFAPKNPEDKRSKDRLNLCLRAFLDQYKLTLMATTSDQDSLSDSVSSIFNFDVEVGVPLDLERRAIFKYLTDPLYNTDEGLSKIDSEIQVKFALRPDVSVEKLSMESAGLTPPDLSFVVKGARISALDRLKDLSASTECRLRDLILLSGGTIKLTPEDFKKSTDIARQRFSDSIGAPRIPSVSWEDVGGMSDVKGEILDTIDLPLKYPHLFSGGVKKRSGILFYGPPGTGKTLLAKAIATTFSLNFFSVKGPELLNMYIGESEANVRRVFQRAREAKPCVVFFDELDSVAPKRGNQGDSGGVMDRIVSQLLAELDGMSSSEGEGVFVVGATNRPDLLDEALLRPGRFDKMLYLGISDTHDKQLAILEALTRKFDLSPSLSLREIADSCPFTFTGADFYALCSDAMLNAMIRVASSVDEKVRQYNQEMHPHIVSTRWWLSNKALKKDTHVQVEHEDFEKARKQLVPSVSEDELQHYLNVRRTFEGSKGNASSN